MVIPMTLIPEDGTDDPDPWSLLSPDCPVDGNPVYVHTPGGELIPVQQDIPTSCHQIPGRTGLYLRPSKFG